MASEGVNPDYITLFFALMCAAGERAQLIWPGEIISDPWNSTTRHQRPPAQGRSDRVCDQLSYGSLPDWSIACWHYAGPGGARTGEWDQYP